MKHNSQTQLMLTERFGKDSLIALATAVDGVPHVRTVDAVYIGGAFYVVTHSQSGKMRQIGKNPAVAISGEWFTAYGIGENLGHVLPFLLKIRLTDGVLFSEGTPYEIDFT